MYVKSGSYVGTGSAHSPVTGIGFTPKLVIVKGGSNAAVIRTDTMATDAAKSMTGAAAVFTGAITSLDAGGFSVGTNAGSNASGTTYYWIAVGDDGGVDIETGSYSGNGSDNRDISLTTLSAVTPNLAIVICETTAGQVRFRTSDMPAETGASSGRFDATPTNNAIQSISSGSFQVGTNADVNTGTGTPTYHWVVLANAANLFKVLTYNGNGVDNRSITGAGFAPDNALTKRGNNVDNAQIRFKDEVGDESYAIGAFGSFANQIQALEADGFQVGTGNAVNISTSTPAYYAFVFKDTAAPPTTLTPDALVMQFTLPAATVVPSLNPDALVMEFTLPAADAVIPTLLEPAPLVLEFSLPAPALPITLIQAPLVLAFTLPASGLVFPQTPAPLVLEFSLPAFTLRRASNTPATFLEATGPLLATASIHSPWFPRHRLAVLTTANGIDRSYTAVSRLGTKDTGQAGLSISKNDPALVRDKGILTHGNLLVITSPIAPPWVGVLVTTSEDDASGQIELSAISLEAVLDGRVTPQGQKYTKSVGANAVYTSLVDEANARNHLGLLRPAITEITNPVEDLEVGGQSVLEGLNELCGRTNSEWWLEYQVSPSYIKATVKLGFMQGFDLSARRHYYQGTHFTASYRQDMSQVKAAVTAIGDFGADLPDRNSVTRVASFGSQHLGVQAAAIHQADVLQARRLTSLPAGLRNEKVTFEVMTGSTSELSRRSELVQERPLQAERMFNATFYSNVNWRDLEAGNLVSLWGTWGGVTGQHVVRVMGVQPSEESGTCNAVCWEPVL